MSKKKAVVFKEIEYLKRTGRSCKPIGLLL
jgi:hypothetical protein